MYSFTTAVDHGDAGATNGQQQRPRWVRVRTPEQFSTFDTQVPWMNDEIAHPFRFIKQCVDSHRELMPMDTLYMLERAVDAAEEVLIEAKPRWYRLRRQQVLRPDQKIAS